MGKYPNNYKQDSDFKTEGTLGNKVTDVPGAEYIYNFIQYMYIFKR